MTKIMLIDATHPEETRVAVVDGRRLEEFDVEVASRHPLKGNIYLAKVTRVEPSLQAAFVEYGGNRHGFLAFSEIHPDYYRIPIADREALLREDFEEAEDEDDQREHRRGRNRARTERAESEAHGPETLDADQAPAFLSEPSSGEAGSISTDAAVAETGSRDVPAPAEPTSDDTFQPGLFTAALVETAPLETVPAEAVLVETAPVEPATLETTQETAPESDWQRSSTMPLAVHRDSLESAPVAGDTPESVGEPLNGAAADATPDAAPATPEAAGDAAGDIDVPAAARGDIVEVVQPPEVIDTVGGEAPAQAEDDDDEEEDDDSERRRRQRHLRRYKIQEVIKRRQILLVQVTKEERGNKGAALTTYLSLAGRYCVLMPNTDRGGGISRRITSVADRKRLKSIVDELDPPEGMAVIVRTAGMERQRSEIKRDFEYLLRLWDEIRETTLRSSAPALIYEEASLIKRSIRDLYTRDIGDIVVAGGEAFKSARSFMRMLAPAQTKRVQFYRDPSLPLFQRYQIESQIAAIHHPMVTLRSGGYIVINQTEALVAVDVNSGRATRERNIEETALRTNLEAAEEVARQLRLRDLAGLIVIDFIDMDEGRNNAAVERRMKDSLRNDRARIQIGRISSFGLLEMSRQRLHASLQEASTEICPHCHGTGRMRSVDSTALHVLRMVEEEITRNPAPGVTVNVPTSVALFILNQKRHALAQLELRRGVRIYLNADDELTPPDFRLERIKQLAPGEELPPAPLPAIVDVEIDALEEEEIPLEESDEAEIQSEAESRDDEEASSDDNAERGRGRGRRRRRRGRGGRFQADEFTEQAEGAAEGESHTSDHARPAADSESTEDSQALDESEEDDDTPEKEGSDKDGAESDESRRRRRRGRRGGRRRSRRHQDEAGADGQHADGQQGEQHHDGGSSDAPEASHAGSGDQPEIPADASLPPQWQTETGQAGGQIEPDEKPRRARRPRRSRDDDAPESVTQSVTAEAPAPVAAIEPAIAASSVSDAASDEPKKRGWWRRLIE